MDDDYYSSVYTWFERCGIISDIRTHLRQNLVNTLKRKDLTLCKTREARTAKQYVYDMLIAEYLFSHNYSFTLSIFASEVPLLVNFCDNASRCSSTDDNGRVGGSKCKLQNDYIAHTLETLGIDPNKPEGRYIVSNYMSNDVPLLLSILHSVAILVDAQSSARNPLFDKETQANLLLEANVADAMKMRIARKRIMQQKQLYDDELRIKERRLKRQASVMKYQLNSLNAKVEEAQNLMEFLMLKEKQLNEKESSNTRYVLQKEMELSAKQNFLTQEADRLQRERDSYKRFEVGLKELQRELIKMQREMSQGTLNRCARSDTRNVHVQTDPEESGAMADECRMLRREKSELTELVREQRARIERIGAQLSRQLEETTTTTTTMRCPAGVQGHPRDVSANAIVSETSSMEDILQDAKMRLRRLEEESFKAERYFCSFVSASS